MSAEVANNLGRPRRQRLHLAVMVAIAAWTCLLTPTVTRPQSPGLPEDDTNSKGRASGGTIEDVVQALEAELALAESRSYYVVVDPEPQRLRLMHHGVLLHELELRSVQVGTPRVLFANRSEPFEAFDRAWSSGRLTPERQRARTEIDTSPDSTDDVLIPPLPEELYPTPDRFRVRYPDGLSVEFVPEGERGDHSLGHRVSDLFASLRGSDRWRVRLELEAEELGRLYRSFPDSCGFLLVSTPARADRKTETARPTRGK